MTHSESTQSDRNSQGSGGVSVVQKTQEHEALPSFSRLTMLDCVSIHRPSEPRIPLTAVFVPTIHCSTGSVPGIFLAKQVAESANAQLRIFSSGKEIRHTFPNYLVAETSHSTLVVDLPRTFRSPLPDMLTSSHLLAKHRVTDTALKRNLSLVLSILLGDGTVFNIDDDVMTRPASATYPSGELNQKPLRLDDVLADFARNPDRCSIAWLIRDQNDHSVVHHALADLGWEVNGMVGSGAQVVRSSPGLPFYPNAYNEDLLFLLQLLLTDRRRSPFSSAAYVGALHQQRNNRYDRHRARSEELADVLAEGLYGLLDHDADQVLAMGTSQEYWQDFLWHRQNQIVGAITGHRKNALSPRDLCDEDIKRDEALIAALAVHSTKKDVAKELAGFVRQWQIDLTEWGDFLTSIAAPAGQHLSMDDALDRLGLTGHARLIPAKSLVPRQLHPVPDCGQYRTSNQPNT